MVWHSVPSLVQKIYPKRLWTKGVDSKDIFLTFDDGPVPGATDFVLEELSKRNMKATFFVVGDNVRKYSSLAREVVNNGHGIGNHTFNHLNGWKTHLDSYLDNISQCDEIIEGELGVQSSLFRPPYGLLTSSQAKSILARKKIVVMWDVLSGDYSPKLSPREILKKTKSLTRPGSIVLFHDQQKTQDKLKEFLPSFLDYVVESNWNCKSL